MSNTKNDVVNVTSLTPEQKQILKKAILELSDSMTQVDAEKDNQNGVITLICNTLSVDKKLVRKLATAYHKSTFTKTVEGFNEFEEAYQEVFRG